MKKLPFSSTALVISTLYRKSTFLVRIQTRTRGTETLLLGIRMRARMVDNARFSTLLLDENSVFIATTKLSFGRIASNVSSLSLLYLDVVVSPSDPERLVMHEILPYVHVSFLFTPVILLLLLLSFLVFDYLTAPAAKLISITSARALACAYCRLGKKLPGSGILYRTSRCALMFQQIAVNPTIMAPNIAVFARQLCGCPYQPPAGDQTCLGYGILPPPPIV